MVRCRNAVEDKGQKNHPDTVRTDMSSSGCGCMLRHAPGLGWPVSEQAREQRFMGLSSGEERSFHVARGRFTDTLG